MDGASRPDECVFCTRRDQPAALFETESLYAQPDKFPLRPGHMLIISKAHLACYGAAKRDVLAELDAAAARVQRLLHEAYGGSAVAFENGVVGQTVFHAHLHLLPGRDIPLSAEYVAHPDVRPIAGWEPVRARYAAVGQYQLLEYAGRRYLSDGHSPSLALARSWVAQFAGVRHSPDGWVKNTTPEDVHGTERLWKAWAHRNQI